jgi:subtilisin family serine protease
MGRSAASRWLPVTAALVASAALWPQQTGAETLVAGLERGADGSAVARAAAAFSERRVERLVASHALVVKGASRAELRAVPGVRYVEPLRTRTLSFAPNDPLVGKQWNLALTRAYEAWLDVLPPLQPVRVAVIDSGIDGTHPELAPRIAAHKSFVGGSALVDTQGHGTFVAGLIAAGVNDGVGIAGLAPSAQLLIAKVVTPQRSIPVDAEAEAIRWAVDNGADVINMSFGGLRDPLDPERDTYSSLEAEAIRYAVAHDVVVVAAVGNGDQAPSSPWKYASYPAALPHVLGVSALARDGSAPAFSNRDAVFNDVAAPGEGILSTFPRSLTASRPACVEQGYSSCGPDEYRSAEGTSFAAPQASALAATLRAVRPSLRADQVTTIIERTATDATGATGCAVCPFGRDPYTGSGRIDFRSALGSLAGVIPPADSFEPNDNVRAAAYPLWGRRRTVIATVDYWDDQSDVYRVRLNRNDLLFASLRGPRGMATSLSLWLPETTSIDDLKLQSLRIRWSARPGRNDQVAYRAPQAGTYFLQVKLETEGSGEYRLGVTKTRG